MTRRKKTTYDYTLNQHKALHGMDKEYIVWNNLPRPEGYRRKISYQNWLKLKIKQGGILEITEDSAYITLDGVRMTVSRDEAIKVK